MTAIDRQAVLQAIADEPEAPGPLPDELRAAFLSDPERTIRAVIRATKYCIGERVKALPAATAAAFDLECHLARQAEFSEKVFGPGARVAGLVDHIAKELHEVLESEGLLEEWIDVVILALDGCWRSGASPRQIIDALVAKQAKNENRTWPDWRSAPAGRAIEHDRSADER